MYLLVQSVSLLVRILPETILRGVCVVLGEVLYRIPGKARIVMSNLSHVHPGTPPRALRRLARANCRRVIEMGLFALASPGFSHASVQKRLTLADDFDERFMNLHRQGPVLVLLPHNTLTEMIVFAPRFLGLAPGKAAVVYRPLDHPKLDAWVRRTRERGGLKLLSRKKGLDPAVHHLKRGNPLAVLADQSAGATGVLGRVAGRTASLSPLPDLLVQRTGARVVHVHIERTGFFRGRLHLEIPPGSGKSPAVEFADWLGEKLIGDPSWKTDWLWMHRRWKTQNKPSERLRLSQKRGFADGFFPVPADRSRAERFYIRLPNWLGDVVMAAPLVRAVRNGRPDVHLTLVHRPAFGPLLELLDVPHDESFVVDSRNSQEWKKLRERRAHFPDTAILFTNSFRGDREIQRTGADQRFGILRPGKRRPLLTHAWCPGPDLDEQRLHQVELWRRFLAHFGLEEEPDFKPVRERRPCVRQRVGFFCGSENSPEKRWSAERWRSLARSLLEKYPESRVELFGTAGDRPIAAEIADGLGERVFDSTGRTDLAGLARQLDSCRLVIGNDTGGMHLANALGVPALVLFGPTNPIRTGLAYEAPRKHLLAEDAGPFGGGTMEAIAVDSVAEAAGELWRGTA